jgi:hypothetical protein
LNLKPNLNLELKTLVKRNRKGIRKSREKEKEKAAQTSLARPARPCARAPAPPDKRFPPVSGSSLSRAPSLSRSLPSGATYRRQFLHMRSPPLSLSLSRGPGSPVAKPLPRTSPFLSLCGGPTLSDPPSLRPPWTGECALAHVTGFLGHDARPHA